VIIFKYVLNNLRRVINFIIALSIVFVISFFIGIIFSKNWFDSFILEEINLFDVLLLNDYLFSTFLTRFFSGIGLLLIVFLFSLTVYTLPLQFIIIIYEGLVLGCVLIFYIANYSILGFIVFILLVFPSSVLKAFSIIVLTGLGLSSAIRGKKCDKTNYNELIINFLVAVFVLLVAIFWESIMFNLVIKSINPLI